MSRIAGLVFLDRAEAPAEALWGMVRGLAPRSDWSCTQQDAIGTRFVWCGSGTANLARVAHVLVAMDGTIVNPEDFPAANRDADRVASSYLAVGCEKTLERLNGDFALALYDERERVFWLARDRFGARPIYYAVDGKRVGFGSRLRAVLSAPGVSADVNRSYVGRIAAAHYRYIDNEPEASPFSQVRQVPAGHVVRVDAKGVSVDAYWSLRDLDDHTATEEELAEQYRALLADAVARRLRVAERAVFTLSSGMDSSSVMALAARTGGAAVDAVSTVYVDKTYDESDDIRSMLEGTASTWHEVVIDTPDVFGIVEQMIEANDEPVATATWLSHYLLCRRVHELGYKSVFGGLGGDELNAGEYEYFLYHFADLHVAGRQDLLEAEIREWVRHHDHPVYRKGVDLVKRGFDRLVDLQRPGLCRPDRARLTRYADVLQPGWLDLSSYEPQMDHGFRSYLKSRSHHDLSRETMPCCLRAGDRNAAVFGLEVFSPFLDHRLVEFMFRVPGSLKIRLGVTKYLLRSAMRGVLPEATRLRVKKVGWNAPAHRWFIGPGKVALRDMVASTAFREHGVYDPARVGRLIDEHEAIVLSGEPRDNHMMFLWQVLNVESWLASLDRAAAQAQPR